MEKVYESKTVAILALTHETENCSKWHNFLDSVSLPLQGVISIYTISTLVTEETQN
jgi:hypothetical protein